MVKVKDSSEKEIVEKVDKLRETFLSGRTLSYEWRYSQLEAIRNLCKENEEAIATALAGDLGRGKFEAIALELLPIYQELDHAIEIHSVPFGVSLIIAPFNYPLGLVFGPLVGAIAAGNCALLKPSELTSNIEKLVSELVPKYLDTDCIDCVFGGIKASQAILAQKFEKIFFTGSTRVGKIVMKAAAENLTNVTMELGGKSPCIIDKSCTNIELAVKRIIWGKFANAGQTCIAPDYILCHEDVYDSFLRLCNERIRTCFGENPAESKDYCRIVSEMHTERLSKLVTDPNNSISVSDRYCRPTLVAGINLDNWDKFDVMREEIFGPILPIIKNRRLNDFILERTPSGGAVVNDCVYQYANSSLPFGGIGPSGMGAAHGKHSFDCFSHKKAVMRRDDHSVLDIPQRYPPYNDFSLMLFRVNAKLPNLPYISENLFKGVTFMGFVAISVNLLMKYDLIKT
eukprot:GSChrysophyteH1.ASY1.ANO1.2372.1 assembled CDS